MTDLGELHRSGAFELVLPEDVRKDRLEAMVRRLLERNAQLERALESRVVIEQAKGVLAERLGVEIDEAFETLRFAARSGQHRLHDLAAAVVASRENPPALERWLARGR